MTGGQNIAKKGQNIRPLFKMNRKVLLIVCCALLGIFLLLYSSGRFNGAPKKDEAINQFYVLEQYTEHLEASITKLCSNVSGVSNVTVAVTLNSGFEYVYATDSKTKPDGAVEVKYITVGSGSGEGTVYITEKLPTIAGIGIVCRGGSNPATQQKLISLLGAAYNVGANKIYITGS